MQQHQLYVKGKEQGYKNLMKRTANEYSASSSHLLSIQFGLTRTEILLGGDDQVELPLTELSHLAAENPNPVSLAFLSTPEE